jgi:predicted enzyme related to lactoylglutathione lyase
MDHTGIVHLELHTGDVPAARALYAAACGWDLGPADGPYLPLDLGGPGAAGLTGGIVAARAGHSLWLPYVRVASVHEATERAEALGAEILVAPQEGPTGCRSVVSTQPGAQIAFWRPAPGARSPRPH